MRLQDLIEKLTDPEYLLRHNLLTFSLKKLLLFTRLTGDIVLLAARTAKWMARPPLDLRLIVKQMEEVGYNSIPVVLITSIFTGMVFALNSFEGFKRFGAESLTGTVVGLAIVRELAPVLTSLMVAGRAASAMAAEIGTMKVTEQIDALHTLATDPVKYLVAPRVLAGLIMVPALTACADFFGIAGGYLVAVRLLGANPYIYINSTKSFLENSDIVGGLIKAAVFGLLLSIVGCYKGLSTEGGAEGVGRSTTGAVVIASMCVLIADFFLTKILLS